MSMLGWALGHWQRRRDEQAADERTARIQAAIRGEEYQPPRKRSWRRELAVGAAAGSWRVSWRYRKLLAPFAGMAALWLSGAMMWSPDGATVIWLAWLLGAVLFAGTKRRRLDRPVERWYAAAVWAGALVWLLAAQMAGVGAAAPALVVAVGLGAVPWWHHHRPRPRPVDPPEPDEPDEIPDRWERKIAAPARPAPGSYLASPKVHEHATTWDLFTDPGVKGQTCAEMNEKLPQIAHGLREPAAELLIEPHPVYRDPSILQFTKLNYNPADAVELLRQPQYDPVTHRIALGPHIDRDGTAGVQIYAEDGMFGGMSFGGSGSGKTREAEEIVLALRWAWMQYGIPTAIVYIDGQNGASSPVLWEHSTIAVGLDEVDLALDCMDIAAAARQAWNRSYGLTGFTPGYSPADGVEGLTGVLAVMDELHAISPGRGKRLGDAVRERRKIGMGYFGFDQFTGLGTFDNEDAFRSALMDGSTMVKRIASRSQGASVPGLAISPFDLPKIPGYSVKVSTPESGERTAPYRSFWLPSNKDRAKGRVPAEVRTVEEWFAATEDAPLDAMTAKAFEPLFAQREARKAAAEERDRRLMAGEPLELEEARAEQRPREQVTAGPQAGQVLSMLGGLLERANAERQRAAEVAVASADQRPTRERIPDLLRERGAMTPTQIAEALGKSRSAVTQALARTEGVQSLTGGRWDVANGRANASDSELTRQRSS